MNAKEISVTNKILRTYKKEATELFREVLQVASVGSLNWREVLTGQLYIKLQQIEQTQRNLTHSTMKDALNEID
jgi:hypothetical protein